MKYIKITGTFHPANCHQFAVGQICPVLDVYEPTGYIKIRTMRTEQTIHGDETYPYDGWIDPEYVEYVDMEGLENESIDH